MRYMISSTKEKVKFDIPIKHLAQPCTFEDLKKLVRVGSENLVKNLVLLCSYWKF